MCSLNIITEDESIEEVNALLLKKEFYLRPDGRISHSAVTDPLNLVLKHMTT